MEAVLVTQPRGPKERKRRQGPRGWVTKTADIRSQRARTPWPPENRLDLWDVNTRLKSIPWIPNETRVSFPNCSVSSAALSSNLAPPISHMELKLSPRRHSLLSLSRCGDSRHHHDRDINADARQFSDSK